MDPKTNIILTVIALIIVALTAIPLFRFIIGQTEIKTFAELAWTLIPLLVSAGFLVMIRNLSKRL